ncbi:MAG: hypothetical protein DMF89_08000 [Acidobacteria bacterium]|nr:MAG: hypothetical protein DMF89_08000 [Acidobacteriota bacterium]
MEDCHELTNIDVVTACVPVRRSGRLCIFLDSETGERLFDGRDARDDHVRQQGVARHLEMGSRHAGVVRRPGQDGAEHREDAGHGEGERHRQPAALEDAQVRRDCAVSDRDRVGRDLLRQGERGRSDVRARRREDSHDDQQSLGEQDPPRHEHQEVQRSFIQAVDLEQNARDLSAAAREAGVVADVVIDVAVGTRSGIPPGEGAVALAKVVDKLPNLKLRGVLSYDGGAQHAKGFDARKERALKNIEPNAETFAMLKRAGLNTEIFSGGGTGTYNIQHLTPGFTDVQVGSYIFMDMQYIAIGSQDNPEVYTDFEPSLTVLVTILNDRFPGRYTADGGSKAFTLNKPNAGVIGEPKMDYNAGSDEFGSITFKEPPNRTYKIGDKLECIVPHCDPVVNEYDWLYGTRKDKVEVVWPITGRGHSQ